MFPRLLVPILLIFFGSSISFGAVLTQPAGLNPGDQYRIVFVTSAKGDATSTDIAHYDAFVTNTANAGSQLAALGVSWQIIGSTGLVSAFNHVGGVFNTPLYLLDGILVANGSADLWDGSISHQIDEDENGFILARGVRVWTGTYFDGSGTPNAYPLGSSGAGVNGAGGVWVGVSSERSDIWVSAGAGLSTALNNYYGISSAITVGAATPEPSSLVYSILGIFILAVRTRTARL